MDFKTQLVYQAAKLRLRKIERYTAEAEDLQRAQLRHILSRARGTELGERYDLGRATDYKDFAQRLPLVEYDAATAASISPYPTYTYRTATTEAAVMPYGST